MPIKPPSVFRSPIHLNEEVSKRSQLSRQILLEIYPENILEGALEDPRSSNFKVMAARAECQSFCILDSADVNWFGSILFKSPNICGRKLDMNRRIGAKPESLHKDKR